MKIKGLGLDEAMRFDLYWKVGSGWVVVCFGFFFLMNEIHGSLTLIHFVHCWGRKRDIKNPKVLSMRVKVSFFG